MNGRPLEVAPTSSTFTIFGCPDSRPIARCSRIEPLDVVVVEIGGQHLDGNDSIERVLRAAVDHTETASADLLRLRQTNRRKLAGDIANNVLLCYERILFGHHTALDRECTWPR